MSADNANNQLQPESRSLDHSPARQRRGLSLSSSLLVITDIQPLIHGFAAEVRALVSCEGIEYVNDEQGIRIRDGEICRHHCRYTLKIREDVAGQIVFTRSHRFNRDELALLESLLVELLLPLRRALLHHRAPDSRFGAHSAQSEPAALPHREAAPRSRPPSGESLPAAKGPRLSLVPLGEEGDYPRELASQRPAREQEPSAFGPPTESAYPPMRGDSYAFPGAPLDRHQRALLAEAIVRSGVGEQELFRQAREVLGYFVYSDDALAFMERLASAAGQPE